MTQDQIMKLVDVYASEAGNHGLYGGIHWHKQQIAARAAVVAALEVQAKDAARYRWLVSARTKEQVSNPNVGLQPQLPQDRVLSELSSWFIHKEWTDLRIDAAMKESK